MKSISALVLLIIIQICPLYAGSAKTPVVLSMDKSISRALSGNNQLLSSKFALKKAQWDRKRAWAELLPTVEFMTRFTRIDDRTFAERDFRRYLPPEMAKEIPQTVFQESYFSSIDASLTLFDGVLVNGLFIANANVRMAERMNRSTRNSLIYQVVSNYLNVLKNKELVKLQEEYLELSKLNYEKAERMHHSGRYSKTEVLRWKVEYQQQKSAVENSRSSLRSSMAILTRLLNINYDEKLRIIDSIPRWLKEEQAKIAVKPENEILAMIGLSDDELIGANAALASAKAGTDASKLMYRNAYSSFLPKVSLSYSHSWRENNTPGLDDYSPKTLMLNLSVPIFTSFRNSTSVKSSYYEYRKNKEDFHDQLRNTRYVLTESVNRILNLRTQLELAAVNSEYNTRNYSIVSRQKEQGLVSNIDFIDAKLSLQNARQNEINTNYDFISSIVEIYYLLGKLNTFIK